jgi:hypothetical protein
LPAAPGRNWWGDDPRRRISVPGRLRSWYTRITIKRWTFDERRFKAARGGGKKAGAGGAAGGVAKPTTAPALLEDAAKGFSSAQVEQAVQELKTTIRDVFKEMGLGEPRINRISFEDIKDNGQYHTNTQNILITKIRESDFRIWMAKRQNPRSEFKFEFSKVLVFASFKTLAHESAHGLTTSWMSKPSLGQRGLQEAITEHIAQRSVRALLKREGLPTSPSEIGNPPPSYQKSYLHFEKMDKTMKQDPLKLAVELKKIGEGERFNFLKKRLTAKARRTFDELTFEKKLIQDYPSYPI